jgi:hypothetical protein
MVEESSEFKLLLKEQDIVIEELTDYIYLLEGDLDKAKYYINVLKGELSVLYNMGEL